MPARLADILDVPSLTVAFAVVYFGSFLFSVLLYLVRQSFAGARLWLIGQALLAFAAMIAVVQSFGLPYEILGLSNTALLACVLVMGHSVWRFRFGAGFPLWLYLLVPLALLAWVGLRTAGVAPRIVLFSGLLGFLSLGIAIMLVRPSEPGYRLSYGISAVFYFIVAAVSLGRTVLALLGLTPASLAEQGVMGGAELLLLLLVPFFNLFGYFLMTAARVEHELTLSESQTKSRNETLVNTVATKDALIAVIGHDLRAPVWSAARYVRSHLLEYEGDLNAKRESIATLAEGLERISGLLDSLLEWALCASGRFDVKPGRIALSDVASGAMADVSALAAAKNVALVPPSEDAFLLADERALGTVLRNLLSNAIKYSKPGGSVRVVVGPKADGFISLSVEDEGAGMKPEQIEKLFVPGRTILTLGTNGEQGKGFGLAISKVLIEAMGASIRVESALGRGTSVMLRFPVIESAAEEKISQSD